MKPIFPLILGTILLLQGCSPTNKSTLSVNQFVIALKPNKNVQGQREDEKILAEELSKGLGIPVKITTPSKGSIIEAGFANGTIDLGYVSSRDAVSLEDNDVAEILLAGEHESINPEGKPFKGPYYYSVWLSLKEKPYSSVADLADKSIAFASRTSTSGFLVPSWDLLKKGHIQEGGKLADFFGDGNIYFGTGYVSAVERVLEGQAEAAAVSYYVFEKDKHLTQEQRNKLKVVARQGPVASHTFCVRKTLPETDRNALKKALLEMVAKKPDTCQGLFGGKLVKVNPIEHLKIPREIKVKVATLKE
tara:strand:+ start:207 stop:1121 length:915 start_codon:yes stop_codon:yes gene_type:complete